MLIDNCGAYAGNFHKMYDDIIKQRMKGGKEVTPQDKENLDFMLFNAYKEILVDSPNEDIATDSLNNLQKMLSSGNVEILDIPKISKSINEQVIDDYNDKQKNDNPTNDIRSTSNNRINENYNEFENQNINYTKTAAVIGTAVALYEIDKDLINSMCTKRMEDSHKDTYEKAKSGDENSINALDVVRKASNYILAKDRLNPKGRDKGALALIEQLLTINTPYTMEMARNVADRFELKDITKEGNLDIDKVRGKLQQKVPNLDIKALNERGKENALIRKDKVLCISSDVYRQDIENMAERARIIMFTKDYGKAIKSGEIDKAESLVMANMDLAQKSLALQEKLYTNFIQTKGKENDFLRNNIETLNSMIQKDKQKQVQPSKIENNNEER